jgi:periplasmic protein TonB
MLFSASKITSYALQKDKFISVSIEIPKTNTKRAKKSLKPTEESHVATKPKEVDIGNLFSKVWTKDINKKQEEEKKFDNKRMLEIQKKLETKEDKKVESVLEKVNQIDADKIDDKDSKTSSAQEVNEYLAKIQATVYKHFYPPKNSEGNTVQAVIELSALGKVLDFRILTYSSNQALNQEADKIKDRLMGVLFPVNPDNKPSSTIVNIISEKSE